MPGWEGRWVEIKVLKGRIEALCINCYVVVARTG
jgi:hypothetical protein